MLKENQHLHLLSELKKKQCLHQAPCKLKENQHLLHLVSKLKKKQCLLQPVHKLREKKLLLLSVNNKQHLLYQPTKIKRSFHKLLLSQRKAKSKPKPSSKGSRRWNQRSRP